MDTCSHIILRALDIDPEIQYLPLELVPTPPASAMMRKLQKEKVAEEMRRALNTYMYASINDAVDMRLSPY